MLFYPGTTIHRYGASMQKEVTGMVTEYAREQFIQASAFLPRHLRATLCCLPEQLQSSAEEIRLRIGRPMTLVTARDEISTGSIISANDLSLTIEITSQRSAYTVLDQVKNGYVAIRGGHRLGICGTGVVKNGEITNLRQISSLSLRVAREFPGASAAVLGKLQEGGQLLSTLIISPPGKGKTTLLRDLIRCVSDGQGILPHRVSVADERGELAAMYGGEPGMNIGARTDVVDGCSKAAAMLMLLRGMNPQVIAADEITAPEDVEALELATGCGVALLATAHAGSPEDLCKRGLYRRLMEQGTFQRIVSIDLVDGKRVYQVSKPEECLCCIR